MRIYFERSGGFMGMRVETTIDTSTLPDEEAQVLHEMLDAASFFQLPEDLTTASGGADQFQYKLIVESEDQEPHTVRLGDVSAPPEIQPLLRKLTMMARDQD